MPPRLREGRTPTTHAFRVGSYTARAVEELFEYERRGSAWKSADRLPRTPVAGERISA